MEEIGLEQDALRPLRCRIGVALSKFDSDDKIDLIAALDDDAIQHSAIARVLTKHGMRVSYQSVSNHRRGLCGCPR